MAICPKCNKFYFEGRGALSRRSSQEICSKCGLKEAAEDMENYLKIKEENKNANDSLSM